MSVSGFSSPWWFLLLAVVAALVAGYVVALRSRRKRTMKFTNLELLERVAPRSQSRLRHVPAALLVVSLLLLIFALAGPTAEQKVPRNRATVMLVIDVSLSMEATPSDVLMSVGHSEHSVTVMAETRNDFSNIGCDEV